MVSLTIKADMRRATACIDAVAAAVYGMSEADAERFADAWRALEAAGAESMETFYRDGVIYVAISDDLRRHCQAFGVTLPERF